MMDDRGSVRLLSLSNVARIAIFAALAFGVNAPFLAIPNIETFSLALFLTGLFLGKFDGVATSIIAGFIFIFFNPNGPQLVLTIGLTQVFGFVLFGLTGGAMRKSILINEGSRRSAVLLAVAGLVLTFWYDFSTNVVFALTFGPFWPTLIGGLSFAIVHIISNTVLFGLCGALVYKVWRRIEYYLPPLAG